MWTIVAPSQEAYERAQEILRANYLVPFAQAVMELKLYPIAVDVPVQVRRELESLGCTVIRRQ